MWASRSGRIAPSAHGPPHYHARARRTAKGAARRPPHVIRDQLLAALDAALDAAGFPAPPGGIELTPPKDKGHGDFTTNVALQLAKPLGMKPRDVAARLALELEQARDRNIVMVGEAGRVCV